MIKKSVILFFLLIQINGFAQNINEWGVKNDLESVLKIEKKVALVIANTNYDNKSWNLKNPINDGKLMYKTFKKLNFEVEFKMMLLSIEHRVQTKYYFFCLIHKILYVKGCKKDANAIRLRDKVVHTIVIFLRSLGLSVAL